MSEPGASTTSHVHVPSGGLPPDNHVHTEYSWDAHSGSMVASCERAIELGLPSIAFTEHVDLTPWAVPESSVSFFDADGRVDDDGYFRAPAIDLEGYFASIERCRHQFSDLRILTGLEIGEPHWAPELTVELLSRGTFDRVLGSLHSLTIDGEPRLVDEWFKLDPAARSAESDAVRAYLSESIAMINTSDCFEVFAHIDYFTRQILRAGRHHDPSDFEEEYRELLVNLAAAERVLEINTRLPLDPTIVCWWHDVGGGAVSFGSDAHRGPAVGHGFADAAAMAEAAGFRRQNDPCDFWRR